MPKRHNCQARQYGDQMMCAPCGLNWDVNDPEPPECRKVDRRTKQAKVVTEFEAGHIPECRKGIPVELPPDVAAEMAKVYHANEKGGRTKAMQAAYRLFLDQVEI